MGGALRRWFGVRHRRWTAVAAVVGTVAALLAPAVFVGAVPGSGDPGYGTGGYATIPVGPDELAIPTQVVSTPSGAVWAAVRRQEASTGTSFGTDLMRFDPSGALVGTAPLPAGVGTLPSRYLTLLADGESVILLASDFGSSGENVLTRILPDLTVDTSFAGDGALTASTNDLGVELDPNCTSYCNFMFPMIGRAANGGILLVNLRIAPGWTNATAALRLTSDGFLDTTFGTDGFTPVDLGSSGMFIASGSFVVESTGRIVIAHSSGVVRLDPDGSPDASFASSSPTPGRVQFEDVTSAQARCGVYGQCAAAVGADGTIYVGGAEPGGYGLIAVEPDGDAAEYHSLCTQAGGFVPGCGEATSLFVGAPGELHMIAGNALSTLSIPLAPGPLTPTLTATQSFLVTGSSGPDPQTAFVGGGLSAPGVPFSGVIGKIRLDVPPSGPTGTVSPSSGTVAVGDSVPITFSCSTVPCFGSVFEGDVPQPIPPGYVPPSPVVFINSGDLLDTSTAGIRTVVVGVIVNGVGVEVARSRIEIGGGSADTAAPDTTVTSPSAGAAYAKDEQVLADYGCTDPGPQASGVASCELYVVDGFTGAPLGSGGSAVAVGAPVPTSSIGRMTTYMVATDVAGNTNLPYASFYDVMDGVAGTTVDGGTLSSGPAPTAADSINTAIITPVGGFVRVLERDTTSSAPLGHGYFGREVAATHPASSASSPTQLTFSLHSSLLAGTSASAVKVWFDGMAVPACATASLPAANPDPCIKSKAATLSGGVAVRVLTSQGGTWNLGRMTAVPPGAPTDVVATAASKQLSVSWTAPVSDGGAPISASIITATPVPGSIDPATGTAAVVRTAVVNSPVTSGVVAASNGVAYEVTVKSRNGIVSTYGASSAPFSVSTPTVPDQPSTVTAVRGIRRAQVSWSPPSSDGGSPLTRYDVTATPTTGPTVTKSVVPPLTSIDFTGLADGATYTFVVRARSAVGASAPSIASAPITTGELPAAAADVLTTAGPSSLAVSWTAPPADPDFPVTRYAVKLVGTSPGSSPHTVSKTLSPVGGGAPPTDLVVGGLKPGWVYGVTVTATNAVGAGPAATGATAIPFLGAVVNDLSVVEGSASTPLGRPVTIKLSSVATSDVTVSVTTENGSAASPGDYASVVDQLVTIPAGKQSASVSIPVVRDRLAEDDESFGVRISDGSGATITRSLGTVTIVDDD